MFPFWIDFEKLIHKDIIEMFSSDVFRGILRNSQSGLRYVMPMIHVYGFSKAEDPEHDFNEVSTEYYHSNIFLLLCSDSLFLLNSFYHVTWFISTYA